MTAVEQTSWTKCPTGALAQLPARARRARLVTVATRTTAATLLLFCALFSGWYVYLQTAQAEYQYYGLTCSDVRELLPRLELGKLDERRAKLLIAHVRRCPTCADLRNRLPVSQEIETTRVVTLATPQLVRTGPPVTHFD